MHRSHPVAGHGGTAALRCSAPAIPGHGKGRREACELHGDDANLTKSYLGDAKCSDELCPRARWRGGENATALCVVFRACKTQISVTSCY